MEQLGLLLRDQKKSVSIEIINAQNTFKDALKLCKSVSGLDDKQICMELEVEPAQWSRIWNAGAHFPENKFLKFMSICGNIIPFIWLSLKLGYAITPLKSEVEMENEMLKGKLAEKEKELESITEFFKKVKGV